MRNLVDISIENYGTGISSVNLTIIGGVSVFLQNNRTTIYGTIL
jgi:hypothetical protein